MSLAEGITALIAVYGAVLSSYVALQHRRRDRAQIQVSGNSFIRMYATDPPELRHLVQIRATNVGFRPVEIHHVGFLDENGDTSLLLQRSKLSPHHPVKALQDGETAVFYYELADVLVAFGEKATVFVEDGAGRRFTGPLDELHDPA